jgi:hypothetical protein
MDYSFNTNFATFVRNKYLYPFDDYQLNPEELNFGLEYNINVAAIWIGGNSEQYAYCDLTTDTSLTLSHSLGSLSSFTINSNTITANSSSKISLNSPLVECLTEIKAPLGTFASLSAPYKMFDIVHPSRENMRLKHACLEGPDISVFIKGKLLESNIIVLPDYWKNLVDVESIVVNLTQIGKSQDLIVETITESQIKIKSKLDVPIHCFYVIMATRKDVEPLEVETAI